MTISGTENLTCLIPLEIPTLIYVTRAFGYRCVVNAYELFARP